MNLQPEPPKNLIEPQTPKKEGVAVYMRFVVVLMVTCGLIEPLVVTWTAGLLWPHQATGSILTHNGRAVGSALVAQPFHGDHYLIGRPSAANHDPTAAAGSNASATSSDLRARLLAASAEIARREQITPQQIPPDLLTASGSGLDPHISPEAAAVQAQRIARARNLDPSTVQALIREHTELPSLGFLGQPRVNVLRFNLALDANHPHTKH